MFQSHAIYNSIGCRKPDEAQWAEKAFHVQQRYWLEDAADDVGFEKVQSVTAALYGRLHAIRSKMRDQLDDDGVKGLIKHFNVSPKERRKTLVEEFSNVMKGIAKGCTGEMVKFAGDVIEHSISCLGSKPPCSFVALGLGSTARGEATPYSDLEYIFIVETKDDDMEQYFEKLAITSYFLIGNMRETKLSSMAIDELDKWFVDTERKGFCTDGLSVGAGSIPTGNTLMPKNRYIVTADELFARYEVVLQNPVEDEAKTGDMTSLVHYTREFFCFGPCGKELLAKFTSKKKSIKPNQNRREVNLAMFQQDVEKYNFKPETHLIGNAYSVNSKREIYRYPSILLFNLSIISETIGVNSWETLLLLKEKGVISETIYNSLFFLLACSCYVRLSAYLHHNAHDDRVSILPNSTDSLPAADSISDAGRRWFLSKSLFLEHCEHALPLKDHIKQCAYTGVTEVLASQVAPTTWLTKFRTLFSCHRWVDAWELFQKHFHENLTQSTERIVEQLQKEVDGDVLQLWFIIYIVGYSLSQQRKYEEGLDFYSTYLNMIEKDNDAQRSSKIEAILAACYDEAGACLVSLNKHREAILKYQRSLQIRRNNHSEQNELLGKSYYHLGLCFRLTKQYDEAENYLIKALEIYNALGSTEIEYDHYGDPENIPSGLPTLKAITSADSRLECINNSSVMLGNVLLNLGIIYHAHKWYQRAFNYFYKTKQIFEDLYGTKACHKDITMSLLYLSHCCGKLNKLDDADRYFRQASAVLNQLFSLRSTQANDAGQPMPNKNEPLQFYKMSAEVLLRAPGYQEAHSETAKVVLFAGMHLAYMKQHEFADSALSQAIEMYRIVGKSGLHNEEIAMATSQQGLNFWKWGNVELAHTKFVNALEMLKNIDSDTARLEAAETAQHLGLMYAERRDQRAAIYLREAQKLFQQACGSQEHPKLIEINQQVQDI